MNIHANPLTRPHPGLLAKISLPNVNGCTGRVRAKLTIDGPTKLDVLANLAGLKITGWKESGCGNIPSEDQSRIRHGDEVSGQRKVWYVTNVESSVVRFGI